MNRTAMVAGSDGGRGSFFACLVIHAPDGAELTPPENTGRMGQR